jgi:hypothetical protein
VPQLDTPRSSHRRENFRYHKKYLKYYANCINIYPLNFLRGCKSNVVCGDWNLSYKARKVCIRWHEATQRALYELNGCQATKEIGVDRVCPINSGIGRITTGPQAKRNGSKNGEGSDAVSTDDTVLTMPAQKSVPLHSGSLLPSQNNLFVTTLILIKCEAHFCLQSSFFSNCCVSLFLHLQPHTTLKIRIRFVVTISRYYPSDVTIYHSWRSQYFVHSMEYSPPSCEANSSSASQEMSCISWNTNVHYRFGAGRRRFTTNRLFVDRNDIWTSSSL